MRNNVVFTANNSGTISNTNKFKHAPVWKLSLWELCSHIESCMPDAAPILQRKNVSWGKNAAIFMWALKLRQSNCVALWHLVLRAEQLSNETFQPIFIQVSRFMFLRYLCEVFDSKIYEQLDHNAFFYSQTCHISFKFINACTYLSIMFISLCCNYPKALVRLIPAY